MNNPALNSGLLSLSLSRLVSSSKGKMDLQNAFRYGNYYRELVLKETKKRKEVDEGFISAVYTILDWADILGSGYTTANVDKLNNWFTKYTTKKYSKLQKYILKNYDEDGLMSDKELKEWVDELIHHLELYIDFVKSVTAEEPNLFKKFDREYYNYAKEEFDSWLDDIEE